MTKEKDYNTPELGRNDMKNNTLQQKDTFYLSSGRVLLLEEVCMAQD